MNSFPPETPSGPASPKIRDENDEISLYLGSPTLQSRMSKSDPTRLLLEYTRLMMGFLLFVPHPRHITMIGLGGGSLARYCHRRLAQARFTAVELSHEVIALRDTFGLPPDGPDFCVVCRDGADYLHRSREAVDVLLVDGFDQNDQPEALCSRQFYDDCRRRLAPGGIAVFNLCTFDPLFGRNLARLNDAFDNATRAIETDERTNTIVFASPAGDVFPASYGALAGRLGPLEPYHPISLELTAQKLLKSLPAGARGVSSKASPSAGQSAGRPRRRALR